MSVAKTGLPETEVVIDENHVKTITSYKYNEKNQLVKVVKKVQMVEVKEQVLKRVLERRNIKPFNLPPGGNEGVTIQNLEDIYMEKPEEVTKEEKPKEEAKGIVCRFCQGPHFSARCPYRNILEKKEEVKESPSSAPVEGRYVPPARRKNTERTTEYKDEEEGYSVRIMNVADDVTDHELRDLFRDYKYTKLRIITDYITKKSRGFAFVNFERKEDAERAIANINGYALHHLILSLSFSEKKKSSGPRYSTGYGKALPQNVRK